MTIEDAIQEAQDQIKWLAEGAPDRMRIRAALEALLRVSELLAEPKELTSRSAAAAAQPGTPLSS